MTPFNIRSLLLAAFVLSNCITWTTSRRHQHAHNVTGHRSRHRRQGAGLFLSASYVIPGGEGHGWGEWGELSPCSRTCGGGVASQKRICLQIGPDGQPQCSGGDTKYFSCQTQDCPAGSKDFRAEQCSEYDNIAFRDIKYRWVPYTKAQNPCELNCMPHGERFYYRHKTKVVDGTRCNDESFDVCVNGTCQPVGCDMMLGSSAREDKCRECRGNGANCHTISAILDTQEIRQGYNDMLLIPEGATTIIIEEQAPSDNYLALRAKNGTYYLNGDYHIDFPRSLIIAGALWYYERSQQGFAAPDKLRCLGPTNEPLYLSLLLQGKNVGIKYEYSVPTDLAPPTNKRYNWVHEKFTPCSVSCGGGFQTRNVTCRSREELELVDEGLCDDGLKPPTNQTCSTQPCDAEWAPGPWGKCSKRCGKGGTRSREVHCQKVFTNGHPSIVKEKECFELRGPKPELFQECNENATCPVWFTGPWKPCNRLCDEGKKTRQVVCYQKNGRKIEVLSDEECEDEKPEEEQTCMLQPCDGVDWVLSDWSGCDSCLSKVRTRVATCVTKNQKKVNESFCAYHPTPVTEEPCDKSKLPACEVQWYATQWSKCSVECGTGEQNRKVFCGLFDGASVVKVDDSRCANQTKYKETKPCEVPKEKCPAQWFAGPWSICSKKCGNDGEQYRRVMCLRGGEQDKNCDPDLILSTSQPCNIGPCNKDELLPLDAKTTPIMDEFDYCDEEDYDETGLEAEIEDKLSTLDDIMFSDSPSTTGEGSGDEGWSSSYAELESRFTDSESTLSSDELLTVDDSGSGFSTLETFITEESTGSSSTDDSTASSSSDFTTDSTTSGTETSSSATSDGSTESTVTEVTESSSSDETTLASTSNDTDVTSETSTSSSSDDSSEITTVGSTETTLTEGIESTISTSDNTEETGSTSSTDSTISESTESTLLESTISESTSESESTVSDLATETVSTETGSTETGSTETGSTETGSTESTVTEETSQTETSETTTDTSDSTTETSGGTTETSGGTTDTSLTTDGSESTAETSESTTETSVGTTETSLSSTESSESTTETSGGTTETSERSSTASSEAGSSTETTEGTTETGSTESTSEGSTSETVTEGTTETGSTETPESTVSEGSSETSATSESEGSTTESGLSSTVTEETGSTESTEFSTTVTSETGSTESTEPTETTSTEISGSTESTEYSSTLSSEGTESTSETSESSESSTTESSGGTTPWDLSTIVETTNKPRQCRPRFCVTSTFGCCSDNKTAALGPFDDGCPKPETCMETKFKCCPDGVSPAKGPNNKGCPVAPCEETLFGCCSSDNTTAAEGNDQEGCPPPPPACLSSKYGCCNDNETEATGPGKKGCPETTTTEGPAATTTAPSAAECADSEYGCCSDNETAAEGPDKQGCPCNTTEFGCCPDSVEPAHGPEFEGCAKLCNSSIYGCCGDGKTPAHGPDNEGCCLLYAFGCCPDNYKPADGPHLEGCGCEFSQFGCCPDNVTIASGPNNKGCGCEYSEYGCCPDRHTEASGPEFEGCLCHTYQFGCCPDGVTIARGSGGQGCHCQQSKFGCCGDEQTHATGPNQQGCDCSTSKYGCCPDGVSAATGPKFLGCTDIPENKQASCNLAFARGPCRNYSVYWYFDNEYGGCSRFWYGGCEGNGNRFVTKEECEDVCVSPPPKDTCKLPQSKGACLGYNVRWYYDNDRGMCSNFVYGGCLGNNNNFETRVACQAQCEPEKSLDQCNLSIERGTCAGNYPRWGFNKQTRSCEQFIWGGCEGNTNRFSTEAACLQRCNPPGEPKPECLLAQEVGNCSDVEAVWAFSQSENRCLPFYYTGCGGNENRFTSLEACQDTCPSAYVPDMCTLPSETGDCANYREKWYFDTKDQRCRQFYYGGCGGNSNNFNTEQECSNRCSPPVTTTTMIPQYVTRATTPPVQSQEKTEMFCFLPLDPGPCNTMSTRYGYDYTAGKCVSFQYGGCGGNRNNFPDEEYCQHYCKPAQDVCQLPMSVGPCEDSQMMWFYDVSSDSCRQFTYGGCEGNDNRFESREACERRCKAEPEPATPAPTTVTPAQPRDDLPQECLTSDPVEECSPQTAGEVWYFQPHSQQCISHENLPSGSQCRNTGVFRSQEACERSCGVFRNLDVCRYGVDPGSCKEFVSKYHYNASSGRCEEFAYGGCLGGPNRFSTVQECEDICLPSADPCKQPPEPGNCLARYVLWYYDEARDACNQFIYGGCGGNQNKFESREICERRCRKEPGEVSVTTTTTTSAPQKVPEECVTPASLAPCGTNVTAFYYDTATSSCRIGDIGGCRYSNRYRTEEECERRCGAFRGIDVCRAQLDAGPCRAAISKYYFDASSGTCQPYSYGGCQGGPNRFSTVDECREVCGDAGPAVACLEPVDTGTTACGASPERRWHYSVLRGACLVFAYQGCGGTNNNFRSYSECADVCAVTTSEPEGSSICDRYSEECQQLELTCGTSGVTVTVAPEGCERCACAAPPDCGQYDEACQRLDCKYGVVKTLVENGCEQCSCTEDPCTNSNCSSNEKCVAAALRNPVTHEVKYSAHCVPDEDTNEVSSECEQAAAECAALRCAYGVQRTRAAGGCERCACITSDGDCARRLDDCQRLRCTYGVARGTGADGCPTCSCLEHPCSEQQCPEGERCVATPYRDPISQETQYTADCRTVNKPGSCPVDGEGSSESSCRRECNDDADCRGVGKCCARGCSQLCVAPAHTTHTTAAPVYTTPYTTLAPDVPQAPQSSTETEPEVTASEGGKATLRCIFHGNPPPKITWKRGEITIDGDVGRYRLLSDGALEIVSLYRNDSGVYICVGDNGIGVARQEIRLQVNDPVESSAGISGEPGAAVRGEVGGAAVLRCLAYGFPEPSVYWYRGLDGPLVPFSSTLYEYVERGRALLVRRLEPDTLGEYACLAYNGHGKPATWLVVLEAYQPDNEYIDSPYIVPREQVVAVTPPRRTTETTTTTSTPEIKLQPYTVPVHTELMPSATSVAAGGELSLPCEVDGYPEPLVTWTKDNVRLVPTDRMWITNTRLTIHRVSRNDSGVYACFANNSYSSHESRVEITITEPYVPAKCIDNPYFANCALIVQGKFCQHKYYSRFCCKSCVEAGQLDPSDIEMQGDAPFRKK